MGRIFGITVEKNHVLKKEDKNRKFKYRVFFQGNKVCTQDFESAIFQDLGSWPASMEASKKIGCYGCSPGHSTQQADAEQAYVQAELIGTETWAAIPEEAWPSDWWIYPEGVSLDAPGSEALRTPKYERPVCRLLRALYGHLDAETMWEKHCHKRLFKNGFIPITSWPSCYFHARLSLLLTMYVDDFKLAGPTASLKEGWSLITSELKVDQSGELGLYLGCKH